jgi:hypothetical protein
MLNWKNAATYFTASYITTVTRYGVVINPFDLSKLAGTDRYFESNHPLWRVIYTPNLTVRFCTALASENAPGSYFAPWCVFSCKGNAENCKNAAKSDV